MSVVNRLKKLEQSNEYGEISIVLYDNERKNFCATIARIKGAGRLPKSHTENVEAICKTLNNPSPNRQITDFL